MSASLSGRGYNRIRCSRLHRGCRPSSSRNDCTRGRVVSRPPRCARGTTDDRACGGRGGEASPTSACAFSACHPAVRGGISALRDRASRGIVSLFRVRRIPRPMFRLTDLRALIPRARERSLEWHSLRGNEYHEDWFPILTDQEMNFEAIDLEELKSDKRRGIYFIFDKSRNLGYVGMAASMSLGERFYNGREDCKLKCPSNCGCFGHINSTPQTCRSSRIIVPDGDYSVYCLSELDAEIIEVVQAEVDWYCILAEYGINLVNAEWALGRANYTGRPIVSCELETGAYHHFLTTLEAGNRLLSGRPGVNASSALAPVLTGHQNQNYGYTHRYATVEEIELFQGATEVSELIRDAQPYVSWVDKEGNQAANKDRNSRMSWVSGPLAESDLDHLRKYTKGSYLKREKSGFVGIYMFVDNKWMYRARTDKWKSVGKKRVEETRYRFESAREAAIARERAIVKNGWQGFNKPNFDWKPPEK